MRPTYEEIRRAAYDRWERRGEIHGGDRDDWHAAETELTFRGHYRTIAEYTLTSPRRLVLGDMPIRRCRFCERTSRQVDFGDPRSIVPDRRSPMTAEVCGDCRLDWLDALDDEFRRFWGRLERDGLPGQDEHETRSRPMLSVAAFKSLVAGALLIVPATELPYFVDALEWVSNPDHDLDDRLLGGPECRVYRAPFLHEEARAAVARRVDDEAPVPYILYFLACDGIMVQVPLPMCLRDADLDGRVVEQPERALAAGSGPAFREARGVPLPLALSGRPANTGRRHSSIAS